MMTRFLRSERLWLSTLAVLLGACATMPERTMTAPAESSSASANAVEEINQSISLAAAQSRSSPDEYRIGAEDLLQIIIFNVPEEESRVTPRTMTARVSLRGTIALPLVGEISAKGMTPAELERELQKRYGRYIRNPQVGVMISEYRQRVSVMGAVQKPGVFELRGPKTVMDMLAEAGGITDKAGNQVHVYRQEPKGRKNYVIDLVMLADNSELLEGKDAGTINMPVQAGDVVNIPQAGMYFVDGAVGKPGSYPLSRRYTLTQALANAGGVDKELADYSSVSIYRRKGGEEVETIPVNLEEVLAGNAPDPQVTQDDVIIVPMSGFKYFVKRFVGTIISGVSVGGVAGF